MSSHWQQLNREWWPCIVDPESASRACRYLRCEPEAITAMREAYAKYLDSLWTDLWKIKNSSGEAFGELSHLYKENSEQSRKHDAIHAREAAALASTERRGRATMAVNVATALRLPPTLEARFRDRLLIDAMRECDRWDSANQRRLPVEAFDIYGALFDALQPDKEFAAWGPGLLELRRRANASPHARERELFDALFRAYTGHAAASSEATNDKETLRLLDELRAEGLEALKRVGELIPPEARAWFDERVTKLNP